MTVSQGRTLTAYTRYAVCRVRLTMCFEAMTLGKRGSETPLKQQQRH